MPTYEFDFSPGGNPMQISDNKSAIVEEIKESAPKVVAEEPKEEPVKPKPTKQVEPEPTVPTTEKDDEDEDEDAEGTSDGESLDADDEPEENVAYYLAMQMKSEGSLPEDFDVEKDITTEALYTAFRESNYQTLQEEVVADVRRQLTDAGVSQQELMYARAIHNGIPLDTLSAASVHNRYGQLTDDAEESHKAESIKAMHGSRGLTAAESQRLIDAAENNDELDELFRDSTTFHKNQYKKFQEEERAQAQAIAQERQRVEQQQNAIIDAVVTQRKVMGRAIPEKQAARLRNDIYQQTEVLAIDGQRYPATKFQKFLYDFESNPEVKISAYLAHQSAPDLQEQAVDTAKAGLEKNFLDSYATSVKKKASKKQSPDAEKPAPKPKPANPMRRQIEIEI
jgi:hypothetical protein